MKNLWIAGSAQYQLVVQLLKKSYSKIGYFDTIDIGAIDSGVYDFEKNKESIFIANIVFDKFSSKSILDLIEMMPIRIPVLIIFMHEIDRELLRLLKKTNRRFALVSAAITEEELHSYIMKLIEGKEEWLISEDIQRKFLEKILATDEERKVEGKISATEQRLLELYKQGVSIQKMAEEMKLSRNTIAAYRSKLIKKIGVRSMSEVAAQFR